MSKAGVDDDAARRNLRQVLAAHQPDLAHKHRTPSQPLSTWPPPPAPPRFRQPTSSSNDDK